MGEGRTLASKRALHDLESPGKGCASSLSVASRTRRTRFATATGLGFFSALILGNSCSRTEYVVVTWRSLLLLTKPTCMIVLEPRDEKRFVQLRARTDDASALHPRRT